MAKVKIIRGNWWYKDLEGKEVDIAEENLFAKGEPAYAVDRGGLRKYVARADVEPKPVFGKNAVPDLVQSTKPDVTRTVYRNK